MTGALGSVIVARSDQVRLTTLAHLTLEENMSHNSTSNDLLIARAPFLDGSAALASAGRFFKAAAARWQKHRTIRALDQLSDYMLHDIGVTRGEIPRLVDEIFSDDIRPASLLATDTTTAQNHREQHG